MNIFESLFRLPPKSDIEYYTEEACAAFAYALYKVHGNGTISVLYDPHGEPWNDEHDFEFTHVVFVKDNTMYDIRGGQTKEEIEDHFGGISMWSHGYNPVHFWEDFVGEDEKYPLYGDDEDVSSAISIIRERPSIYGLTE